MKDEIRVEWLFLLLKIHYKSTMLVSTCYRILYGQVVYNLIYFSLVCLIKKLNKIYLHNLFDLFFSRLSNKKVRQNILT